MLASVSCFAHTKVTLNCNTENRKSALISTCFRFLWTLFVSRARARVPLHKIRCVINEQRFVFFRLFSFVSHHLFILIFGDNELTDGISISVGFVFFFYFASLSRVCRRPADTELLIAKPNLEEKPLRNCAASPKIARRFTFRRLLLCNSIEKSPKY